MLRCRQWLLAHVLRKLSAQLSIESALRAGLAVTVVARDDVPQPDGESLRLWCKLLRKLAPAGVSLQLFAQNLAPQATPVPDRLAPLPEPGSAGGTALHIHTHMPPQAAPFARSAPLGIFETEALDAFLSTAAGRQQARAFTGRSALLLCCCMKITGAQRARRVGIFKTLRGNGFACDKSELPASLRSTL